jgi:hypothetical protein
MVGLRGVSFAYFCKSPTSDKIIFGDLDADRKGGVCLHWWALGTQILGVVD